MATVNWYDYSGTRLTGTSTSARTFPNSGVKKADVDDIYYNPTTGHAYVCTRGGDANTATWKYDHTEQLGAPTEGVGSLTLKRASGGSRTMQASWSVPKSLTEGTNPRRATRLCVRWRLMADNGVAVREDESYVDVGVTSASYSALNSRSSFYPGTDKKVSWVEVRVTAANGYGKSTSCYKSTTFGFSRPRAPVIGAPTFDAATGTVKASIATDPGNDSAERLDTVYAVTRYSNLPGHSTPSRSYLTTESTKFEVSCGVGEYQSLTQGQYLEVNIYAEARGLYGCVSDSSSLYVSVPKPAVIPTSDQRHVSVSSRDSSGRVTVPVQVSRSTRFPVEHIKLQALVNVTYDRPERIPANAQWSDTGAVDDGDCTMLVTDVASMTPDPGKHTWVRVKAWNLVESVLCSYSNVVEVPLFVEAPTSQDDQCQILSALPGSDGESILVRVGYDSLSSDADDDADGTQFAWSSYKDAWVSTEQPSTFDVSWDGEAIASGETGYGTWRYAHSLVIRGLAEGTTYYLRARRFLSFGDEVTYGDWCNVATVQTTSTPPSVVLTAPVTVSEGDGISLAWVLSARSEQRAWQVFSPSWVPTQDAAPVSGKTYYVEDDGVIMVVDSPVSADMASYLERVDTVLSSGEDSLGGCTVPAGRVASVAAGGYVGIAVRCSTGGEWVESDVATVAVAVPPDLMAHAPVATTAPATILLEGSEPSLVVVWSVTATNDAGDGPDGTCDQYAGDVAAGGSETLAMDQVTWTDSLLHAEYAALLALATDRYEAALAAAAAIDEGEDGYEEALAELAVAAGVLAEATALEETPQARYQATVTLPEGATLHDGSRYDVVVTPRSVASGLYGPSAQAALDVDLAHKAPQPSPAIEVTPYLSTDETGRVSRGCLISLAAPTGVEQGDVYDVYRVTHDGVELVSQPGGVVPGATVDDPFAPFGSSGDYGYRVACRTPGGSVQWADYGYFMDGEVLRIDWGDRCVELPYDVGLSDSYDKDVEVRTHWDGTSEAYHNRGVSRRASLSTDVLRVDDADTATLVRDLARHVGTAFVRTPDGSAFEAAVRTVGTDAGGPLLAVTIDATQVSLSEAHMIRKVEVTP